MFLRDIERISSTFKTLNSQSIVRQVVIANAHLINSLPRKREALTSLANQGNYLILAKSINLRLARALIGFAF